jgi:hypothetical protein
MIAIDSKPQWPEPTVSSASHIGVLQHLFSRSGSTRSRRLVEVPFCSVLQLDKKKGETPGPFLMFCSSGEVLLLWRPSAVQIMTITHCIPTRLILSPRERLGVTEEDYRKEK